MGEVIFWETTIIFWEIIFWEVIFWESYILGNQNLYFGKLYFGEIIFWELKIIFWEAKSNIFGKPKMLVVRELRLQFL